MDEQQILYAKARTVVEQIMTTVDAADPKVALTALMLLTAKTFRRLGVNDTDTILGVLVGNLPGMIEVWEQAADDTKNVIVFPGSKD